MRYGSLIGFAAVSAILFLPNVSAIENWDWNGTWEIYTSEGPVGPKTDLQLQAVYNPQLGYANKVTGTYPGGSIVGNTWGGYNNGFLGTWSGSPLSLPGLFSCSESSGDIQLDVDWSNKTYPIKGHWTCGSETQWRSIIGRRISEQAPDLDNPKVLIKSVTGDPNFLDAAVIRGSEEIPATPGMKLYESDQVRTGYKTQIVLSFLNPETKQERCTVVVEELSQIKIGIYYIGGIEHMDIWLKIGGVTAQVLKEKLQPTRFTVKTQTATASVRGTIFRVSHDEAQATSTIAVSEGTVTITPTNTALTPFELNAGQQVVVSTSHVSEIAAYSPSQAEAPAVNPSANPTGSTYVSPDGRDIYGTVGGAGNAADQAGMTSEVPQGGCYTYPSTGQMICVDTIGDFSNPEGNAQGGCYTDPETGETICIDTFGGFTDPSSSTGSNMGTAYTMQPDAGSSVPQSLHECETYDSEICGTWTRMGDQFIAQWENGVSATLYVERWDDGAVVLTRQDTVGSSAGLTARYEGQCNGNYVEGTVTWTWNGSTWSGTWSTSW